MPAQHLTLTGCLLLLLSLNAGRAEDFAYVTNNGTIIITEYTGPGGNVEIPSTITGLPVTAIGGSPWGGAFEGCTSLNTITIPGSVTFIAGKAFYRCTNLAGAYFWGNAPSHNWAYPVFGEYTPALLYCLPGTTGWDDTFWSPRVRPWWLPNPLILTGGPQFGVQPGGFGFTISWATNADVVVEARADLANPEWLPLATNTLVQGSSYFSDPEWGRHSQRLYRVREK